MRVGGPIRLRLALAALALGGLLAGCSNVVDGTGSTGGTGVPTGSPTQDFPGRTGGPSPAPTEATGPGETTGPGVSTSPRTPGPATTTGPSGTVPPPTDCPRVRYAYAHLAFDCITSGMTKRTGGEVWPVSVQRAVPSGGDNWVLEEGAGHWGDPDGDSLASITVNVRGQMVDIGNYGDRPSLHTDASKAMKIGNAPAHLLQTTVTINPTWARANNVSVKKERLWIVAVEIAPNDVSLWYVTLPDVVSPLWAKVPDTIKSISII